MATRPADLRDRSTRHKAVVLLVLAAIAILALVGIGIHYFEARAAEARLHAELQQRSATAAQMRSMISGELDTARAILVERTLQKVAEGKLAEARVELAPFASLQDPRIVQIMVLIDKELAIQKSLEQGRPQTAPAK